MFYWGPCLRVDVELLEKAPAYKSHELSFQKGGCICSSVRMTLC